MTNNNTLKLIAEQIDFLKSKKGTIEINIVLTMLYQIKSYLRCEK